MAVGAISSLHRTLDTFTQHECRTPSLSLKAGMAHRSDLQLREKAEKYLTLTRIRPQRQPLAFSILKLLSTLNVSKAAPQSLTNRHV